MTHLIQDMNKTIPEMEPCPFCGSEAELERGSDHHGEWFNLGCSRHWGRVDPGDDSIAGRIFFFECEKTEEEAIALWNARTGGSDVG